MLMMEIFQVNISYGTPEIFSLQDAQIAAWRVLEAGNYSENDCQGFCNEKSRI